ncbi:hypothetical protein [Woeseia oceani]|nr:hypothetical protein [Woeseia oceani]
METRLLIMTVALGKLMLVGQQVGAEVPVADTMVKELDACTLLAPAEIAQVVGRPVERDFRNDLGLQADGSYSSTCVWIIEQADGVELNPRAPLGGRSFVILNATQWPAGSGLASGFLQDFRDAADNGEIPSAPTPKEFGDEALWWGDGLAVRSGDISLGVSVVIAGAKSRPRIVYEEQLAPYIMQHVASQTAD